METNRRKNAFLALSILAFILWVSLPASATSIPIINPSFETPTLPLSKYTNDFTGTGWTCSVQYAAGIWHYEFPKPFPDGVNILYVHAAQVYQDVGTVQADSLYTLQVYVAKTANYEYEHYTIKLVALQHNAVLASAYGAPAGGAVFNQIAASGIVPAGSPYAGDTLRIVLMSNGPETDFDMVTLNRTIDPVPIPSSLILLSSGMIGIGILRRRRA